MSRVKEKITRIENNLRMNELPPEARYFVLEGSPEERDRKQAEIKDELIRKYGETAAGKALFIHIRSTAEMWEKAE